MLLARTALPPPLLTSALLTAISVEGGLVDGAWPLTRSSLAAVVPRLARGVDGCQPNRPGARPWAKTLKAASANLLKPFGIFGQQRQLHRPTAGMYAAKQMRTGCGGQRELPHRMNHAAMCRCEDFPSSVGGVGLTCPRAIPQACSAIVSQSPSSETDGQIRGAFRERAQILKSGQLS